MHTIQSNETGVLRHLGGPPHQISNEDLRFYIAPRRTGSTLFIHLASGCDNAAATSRVISRSKNDNKSAFTPDYSIFKERFHPIFHKASKMMATKLIVKEEFGDDRRRGTNQVNECDFQVLPTAATIKSTRPAFGFRDPVSTFQSWKKKGWNDSSSLIKAFLSCYRQYKHAEYLIPETPVNVHDFFVSSETNSKAIMRTIIRHWGLPYDDTMIDRPRPFASKFVFMNKAEEDIYLRDAAGLFENMNSGAIRRDIPTHNLASRKEIDSIIKISMRFLAKSELTALKSVA